MQPQNTLLNISPSNNIHDLQLAFSKAYPFLKIEFYNERTAQKIGSKKYLESSLQLKAAGLTKPGRMLISDSMTVYQLESNLKNDFGLKIHAFRKSGRTWLEISMTGAWTLKHQNQHGQELSEPPKEDLKATS